MPHMPGSHEYDHASLEGKIAILQEWLHVGENLAHAEGLSFPDDIEFELCEENLMLSYAAMGTINRPFHWRWGKARDLMKMSHHYGLSGIYEIVLPTNPPYAFLGVDNNFIAQLLVILHVLAHCDFFSNNARFQSGISPERAMQMFKAHQQKVDEYIARKGIDKVEEFLSAVFALDRHGRRPYAFSRKSEKQREKEKQAIRKAQEEIEYAELFPSTYHATDIHETKREPDEDICSVILAENRHLEDWEAGLVNIGIEEAMFEQPLLETKILNEGWASVWHKRLFTLLCERDYITSLDVIMEYSKLDTAVVSDVGQQLNPYYFGYKIFKNIEECYDNPGDDHWWAWHKPTDIGRISGLEKMLFARACDHDASFLRNYLTPKLAAELELFRYALIGKNYVVTDVVRDEETFEHVRDALIQNLAMHSTPLIEVVDTTYEGNTLILQHKFDGRELYLPFAKKTMEHAWTLWSRNNVILFTTLENKKKKLMMTKSGFSIIDA